MIGDRSVCNDKKGLINIDIKSNLTNWSISPEATLMSVNTKFKEVNNIYRNWNIQNKETLFTKFPINPCLGSFLVYTELSTISPKRFTDV